MLPSCSQDYSDSTAAVIATSPAPLITGSNKKAQFRVIGGADGEHHKITVKVTTTSGQKLEADLHLNIEEN